MDWQGPYDWASDSSPDSPKDTSPPTDNETFARYGPAGSHQVPSYLTAYSTQHLAPPNDLTDHHGLLHHAAGDPQHAVGPVSWAHHQHGTIQGPNADDQAEQHQSSASGRPSGPSSGHLDVPTIDRRQRSAPHRRRSSAGGRQRTQSSTQPALGNTRRQRADVEQHQFPPGTTWLGSSPEETAPPGTWMADENSWEYRPEEWAQNFLPEPLEYIFDAPSFEEMAPPSTWIADEDSWEHRPEQWPQTGLPVPPNHTFDTPFDSSKLVFYRSAVCDPCSKSGYAPGNKKFSEKNFCDRDEPYGKCVALDRANACWYRQSNHGNPSASKANRARVHKQYEKRVGDVGVAKRSANCKRCSQGAMTSTSQKPRGPPCDGNQPCNNCAAARNLTRPCEYGTRLVIDHEALERKYAKNAENGRNKK